MNEKYKIINKKDFAKYSLLAPLNEISQIPEQLYFYGDEKLLQKGGSKILCVIGSRKMTSYGKQAIDYLLSGLEGQNIIIVSGLAMGIDSEAHKAALRYKLPTITFPGSGLEEEVLYPQSNVKLFRDIIENSGGAFSEYTPDSKSLIYYFPARNRLMAAISDLVLVIEAEEKSGTQITARLALEYNKDVAIVPGSIFSAYSRGTAQLFKDGAYPVTSSQDILELLKLDNNKSQQNIFDDIEKNISNNKKDKNNYNSALFDSLSYQEQAILKLLKAPLHKDELLESGDFSPTEILIALTNLEAKGIVKDNYGEIVRVK